MLQQFIDSGYVQKYDIDGEVRYSTTQKLDEAQGLLQIGLHCLEEIQKEGAQILFPLFGPADQVESIRDVFVLMPFDVARRTLYERHICAVTKRLNVSIGRADDLFNNHMIMKDVWSGICNCQVVIADCTGRNPNVFYEIGMAHTVGKPVILISERPDDVPFDLRALRYIEFATDKSGIRRFEQRLEETLRTVLSNSSMKAAGAA
jgi:hypothetical protein